MENPSSFPKTSGILRALARDNNARDYREFLTVLSEEWVQYSNNNLEQCDYSELNWIDRNVAPTSRNIAAAVGISSGYATMHGLNYMHHLNSFAMAENNDATESYDGAQQFASADASLVGGQQFASAAAGYEPHSYMSQDYHFGESSPNMLRDLAKSLPPPEADLDSASSYYDGYASYQDNSLHYVVNVGPSMDVSPDVTDVSQVVVSSVPEVPNTAPDVTNTLSSQLSDIAYSQSFDHAETVSKRFSMPHLPKLSTVQSPNANEAVSKVKEFATHSTESINQALAQAKETGSSQLNNWFGSVSDSFDGLPEKVAIIRSSGAESFGKVASELQKVQAPSLDTSKLPIFDVASMPSVDMSKLNMPPLPQMPKVVVPEVKMPSLAGVQNSIPPRESHIVVDGSKAASPTHVNFADNSLSDIGHSILGGIKYIGGLMFQFLDWIITAVAGTSMSQIFGSVQTSISTLVDNASSAIVNVLNGLGNLTLKEILQALLTLILVVTDLTLKVMNALVYLLSGKDAGDWVLQANTAVHGYGDQLLATYQDVTHKSLGELATSIGDYSHHVGEELLAIMNSLSTQDGVENVLRGTGGDVSYLSAENVDAIATAVQTALTL
ncbi:hypothetical protein ACHAWO_009649 [Cyclotella atomus]|uniref:Uncharacterized protein n=1 Tax=Cyclotella atomus TaxID=382360 RepID=A0ABD3NEP8_9STRA